MSREERPSDKIVTPIIFPSGKRRRNGATMELPIKPPSPATGVHVDVTIVPIETLKKPEVLLQADLVLAEEQGEEGQQRRLRRIEMLLTEKCALLFLYHTRQHSVYHSALAGVSLNALGQANCKDIWFKQAHVAAAE
ncbi:hypothetical protein AV540_17335 [Brevibacillus parabrevis]|nr:hypothetical protein AV540_17335 [Brevibacillus parabrevis]